MSKGRIGLGISTALALSLCLFGCTTYQQLDGVQFKHKLSPEPMNSAEGWWVVKEDADFYYLEDRVIYKVYYFKVSKQEVTIDIGPKPQFPFNVHTDEVRYLQK
jgi:hypothetical protein